MSEQLEMHRPSNGRPIRITIPAAVAYDVKALQKGIAAIVGRLGCPSCFSGADCRFQMERDFVINEKLEVSQPRPMPLVDEPDPVPWITAQLHPSIGYDLKKIQVAVANLAGRLGCQGCCSGFDILFQQEREFVLNEVGSIRG